MNPRRKQILNYTMAAITMGFILLTVFVYFDPASVFDLNFSKEVQEHQNPLLDSIMEAISWPGYVPASPVIVLITALVFFIFKYKKEALFVVLTMLSGLISTVIKVAVNRPRPTEDLIRVVAKNQQQSFPSGHVLFYVIFFGFLIILMLRLEAIPKAIKIVVSAICLLLIFAVPVSRVYLGAHWFTDVLGGFLLGIICLYVLSYQYLKISRK